MKTAINLAKEEHELQHNLKDMVGEMFRAQLPVMMGEVVHRNSSNVISSVGQRSDRTMTDAQRTIQSQVTDEVMRLLDAAVDTIAERLANVLADQPEFRPV